MRVFLFTTLCSISLALTGEACAATINPGGTGSLGTVNYVSGNLALATTVASRGGSTTSSIDGQPTTETFGTVTTGGNDGAGKNLGFAGGHSWHTDNQVGAQVLPTFFRVNLGDLAGVPHVGNQEFAIGSIEIFGRRDCCGTQFSTDAPAAFVDVLRLDSSINSSNAVTGNSQTLAGTTAQGSDLNTFAGVGSIGRTIDYHDMSSFNELEANGLPNLNLSAADVLEIEINASGNDFVNVEGAATLNGTIDVSDLDGSIDFNDVFNILNAASIDASGLTFSGGTFAFNILNEEDGTQTLQLIAAPEPASLALWGFLAAVAGLAVCRIRRRRQ